MKTQFQCRTIAALMGSLLLTSITFAQETEKAVRMKDLPAAVQATIREQRKGAVLRGLVQETENGQAFLKPNCASTVTAKMC